MNKIPVSTQDLRDCITEAGKILLGYYQKDLAILQKTDLSPVTEADNAVNAFLQKYLAQMFPSAGWLSEESTLSSERFNSSWLWVVDPLDGTKEFINGIPEFSISIGLIHDGLPVMGTVYNPLNGDGAVGEVWSKKLEFWGHTDDFNEKIVVSRTEFSKPKMQFMINKGMRLKAVGSVAYKLLLTANSKADATFSLEPKSEWDICGGVALLLAANLRFMRYDQSRVVFNAENPLIKSWTLAGKTEVVEDIFNQIEKYESELTRLG